MSGDHLGGWEPRPVPEPTPETADYWAGCAEGELRLTECRDCGLVFHYPRAHCPDCASSDTRWVTTAGTGEVYSYSVMAQMGDWPDAALPLILAYVELDEGPRLMTNLVDCPSADVSVGDRVSVQFVPTDKADIAVPVFTPIE